jgi:hypothetical protein
MQWWKRHVDTYRGINTQRILTRETVVRSINDSCVNIHGGARTNEGTSNVYQNSIDGMTKTREPLDLCV